MAAIYSNGSNRWNILGFNFTKRDALPGVYKISMRPTQYAQDNVQTAKIVKYAFVFVLRCLAQTLLYHIHKNLWLELDNWTLQTAAQLVRA